MSMTLDLHTDRLGPGARVDRLAARIRALYVRQGSVRVSAPGAAAALAANTAWFAAGPVDVLAGPEGAEVLRWVVVTDGPGTDTATGDGVDSSLVLSSPLALNPRGAEVGGYLLRCDRVDLPPGGEAFLHAHQGPGTRCLLHGAFTVETGGREHHLGHGEAWFETGPDPVYARAGDDGEASFVRVMILPRDLRGKSSISYLRDEDRDRPKSQRYQVFIDEEIAI